MAHTLTVDEAVERMTSLSDRVRSGDVAAARELADLWSGLHDHMTGTGAPPAVWVTPPDPQTCVTDDGEMFLDFGEATSSLPGGVSIVSGSNDVTYAEKFAAQTPNLRPSPAVEVPVAPSSLDSATWQHSLDAGTTSVAVQRKIALSPGKANHQVFWAINAAGVRGRTDDELEVLLERAHQSVSATRRGLVIARYLEDSGQKRDTRSGNSATVWVLTDWAKDRVARGLEKRP